MWPILRFVSGALVAAALLVDQDSWYDPSLTAYRNPDETPVWWPTRAGADGRQSEYWYERERLHNGP